MPRHARFTLPGVPLHVIQRGNNRCACFVTAEDRIVYMAMLEELCRRHPCAVHAYVLMTNHVHLLVTPEQSHGVSGLMKDLGQRYVQYVNRHHKRTGSLWEGRFRSSLVDNSLYLLRCQRYIELNPVRACMVARAVDYEWSSFRANAFAVPSPLVTPSTVFMELGSTPDERRAIYREMFETGTSVEELQQIRDAVRGGFAYGSDEFIARVERTLGRRVARADRKSARLGGQIPLCGTSGLSPVSG
jgi:putative transposase